MIDMIRYTSTLAEALLTQQNQALLLKTKNRKTANYCTIIVSIYAIITAKNRKIAF